MVRLNRAQRLALKRVYDRAPIYPYLSDENGVCAQPLTYREFRKQVRPGPGCVMIRWAGMWLGIEPDGYTHS